MSLPRRDFLHRSLLGLLSLTVLPTSISLMMHNVTSFSINGLFARLSFKQKRLSRAYLNLIPKSVDGDSRELKRSKVVLHTDKTICIPEIDQITTQKKEHLASIYQITSDGYAKVFTLNQVELIALENMADHLKKRHNITEPSELSRMLVPVQKTIKHKSAHHLVENECSSPVGYYTENGYCSIKIYGQRNCLKIQTSLLNFDKVETYQNKFEINCLA